MSSQALYPAGRSSILPSGARLSGLNQGRRFGLVVSVICLSALLTQSGCANVATSASQRTTHANSAPSIITQPTSQTINGGQTATFSVTASGTAPLSYQWEKNGGAISGATSSSYTTPPETTGAQFAVAVSNSLGIVTSSVATVTVNTVSGANAVNPGNLTLAVGSTQAFSANISGTANTAMTWTVSGAGCISATCGTISANGLYVAPMSVPYPPSVTVKATSATDPTKSASTSVTIIAAAAILLSLSPANASVATAGTQPFNASVTGTSNTSVSWNVKGAGCSGSACGSLSTSGLTAVYSAPPVAPSPASVTVNAVSAADATRSASATVTIVPIVAVTLTPTNPSISLGTAQQFNALVTGTANTAVTWSVSGAGCAGAPCGTINSSGLYTAPAAAPSGTVRITATSVADPTKSASAVGTFAPQIATGGLPNGQVGVSFQGVLTAAGGVAPYQWTFSGSLPAGLSLNAASGVIAGIPTQAGSSSFRVLLTDSAGQTAQGPFAITIAAAGASNGLVITPSVPPAVNQGTSFQFQANAAGTWSCSGTDAAGAASACKGSINSATGVYTAPATVIAQQSAGGYQLLPNNHIFNTRIDSLPLRSDSATMIADMAGHSLIYYEIAKPINYVNASTPTQNMGFYYTPGNDGVFKMPAYPIARAEGGWISAINGNGNTDHHILTVDTSNGNLQDFYQYYAQCTTTAASVANNVATLTCAPNPTSGGFTVGKTIGVAGFSGNDSYLNGASFVVTAASATTVSYAITHANAVASTNGSVSLNFGCMAPNTTTPSMACNSQGGVAYSPSSYALPTNGATDAAGMYLTPLLLRVQEVERAIATGGAINHALRMTINTYHFKSAYIWPATSNAYSGGSASAQYYGERLRLKSSFNISTFSPIAQILLTQAKQYGFFLVDGGTWMSVDSEYAKWPKAYIDAELEIALANIQPSNLEVVDESSYMLSSSSGECTCNREIVTFTRASDGAQASVDVVLTGVAVNFPFDLQQIQVGAPAQTFAAIANTGTVTYSMSPSVGTLDSNTGLYNPPTSLAAPARVTVTATSTVNSSVTASYTLNVFPAGAIRLVPGSAPTSVNGQMNPTNYVDTTGNTWYSMGDDGGYSGDNGTITGTSDPTLYRYEYAGYVGGNDMRFDFIVPNGTYTITFKGSSSWATAGYQLQDLEVNGNILYPNLDLYAVSGGQNVAWDWKTSITITNNKLSFVQRVVNDRGTHIGALEITQ